MTRDDARRVWAEAFRRDCSALAWIERSEPEFDPDKSEQWRAWNAARHMCLDAARETVRTATLYGFLLSLVPTPAAH